MDRKGRRWREEIERKRGKGRGGKERDRKEGGKRKKEEGRRGKGRGMNGKGR